MRKLKKLVTLLAALALFVVPFSNTTMTASAEGGTTYYIKFMESDNDWRFQIGGWDDSLGYGSHLYYLHEHIKDGDTIVVDGGPGQQCYINIPEVRLANVTSKGANVANITAKEIDEVYALFDGTIILNGHVKKAYVYEKSVVNFNNDVDYLEVICNTDSKVHAFIGVQGTVGHLYAYGANNNVKFDCYNFKPGTFSMYDGNLNVLPENYTTTPPAASGTASTPAASTGSAGSEYDDVPKTGENTLPYVMVLGVLALCVCGKLALRKSFR
ncbi:MAG: hypothetical protein IKL04_04205 [Lachnospiraceae bacterium]|nr:hypothetical protein [Lachnospiraceae bacterium]